MAQLPPGFVLDEPTPQPAPQQPSGPIYGAPRLPPQDSPAEIERLRLAQQEAAAKAAKEAQEKADKETKFQNAQSSAISSLQNVLDKLDEVALDAADNRGWFETGTSGSLMRKYGPSGTAAYDLAANIKTIDANSAFTKLQEMRDNSPTGGALGQVAVQELEMLMASIANLDPNQSQGQFMDNLAGAKKAYLDMLRRLDPAAADAYATKPGIRFKEDGSPVLATPADGSAALPDGQVLLGYGKNEDGSPYPIYGYPSDPSGGDSPPSDGGSPDNGGRYSLENISRALAAGTGDLVEGAANIPGLIINPINTMAGRALGYKGYTSDFGQAVRDALGLPEGNQTVSAINQAGGAALTGSLAGRGAAMLANPGAWQNALARFGATPGRDMIAGAGAGAGGEIGREVGGLPGQVAGTLAGGLAGYGGGNALLRAGTPRTPTPLAEAASRQNVDLLPADVGGRGTRIMTSGARSSPIGSGGVERAAQRTQQQIGAAADRAARSQADEATTDVAGQGVRSAAERYTKATSARGSRLYDRAYEAAKGVRIKPLQTLAAIDDQLARLRENPSPDAASMARELQGLRTNIENGVSVRGLRDARTNLSSGVFDGKLRSGPESAMYKSILGNIADDIDLGLRNAGREGAANMFRRADAFWKGRIEHIDEVLQPILGAGKSGEEIVSTLEGMARGQRGGNARLSRLLANMTEEEAGNVRAVVVDRLGKANPGAQNAEGDVFSAATFLTNWNKMTPQAKTSLFSDSKLRANLNDIAMLAEGTKASQALNNTSNTAAAGIGAAYGAGAATSPLKTIMAAGGQLLTARLMASSGFARILARTSKMPEASARRSLADQLKVLATREPALAADARALQQHLQQTFGQSPVRAVASEEEGNGRRVPPQQ